MIAWLLVRIVLLIVLVVIVGAIADVLTSASRNYRGWRTRSPWLKDRR